MHFFLGGLGSGISGGRRVSRSYYKQTRSALRFLYRVSCGDAQSCRPDSDLPGKLRLWSRASGQDLRFDQRSDRERRSEYEIHFEPQRSQRTLRKARSNDVEPSTRWGTDARMSGQPGLWLKLFTAKSEKSEKEKSSNYDAARVVRAVRVMAVPRVRSSCFSRRWRASARGVSLAQCAGDSAG